MYEVAKGCMGSPKFVWLPVYGYALPAIFIPLLNTTHPYDIRVVLNPSASSLHVGVLVYCRVVV